MRSSASRTKISPYRRPRAKYRESEPECLTSAPGDVAPPLKDDVAYHVATSFSPSIDKALKLGVDFEMIFNGSLGSADNRVMVGSHGCCGLFNGILDDRLVYYRQQFPRRCLGG